MNELTPKNKVLVIGLDGATFDLIKPWAAEGHLPTLNRLLTTGTHGELESTFPPMTAPAWTSFATGTNPGKHRLYDWVARSPDSYHFKPLSADKATAPTLYRLLSDEGRRVCSFNVPMTFPPMPVNGLMVAGMPAAIADKTLTYPPELFDEIMHNVGDYIVYPDPGQAYSDSGIDAFLQRLYRTTELRVKTFHYLNRRENWDFMMMVFNGTDTVSHAMWKFMDQTHPLHDPAKAAKYGHAIRNYYRTIDGYLAEMIADVDDDTTLILMSDHGFGPFHKFIHVNNWLIQQGFMHVKTGVIPRLKKFFFQRGFTPMNVYNAMMSLGLGGLKKEVVRGAGSGQQLMKLIFLAFQDIDWARTQAYSLGNIGQINLNVAGREPQGSVQPGDEYQRVRDQVMDRLSRLRDQDTGEMAVEAVYPREEIYSGPQLQHAPDILFMPRRLEYFGFGEYEFGSHQIIEPMKRGISGTHRMNGIFMAHGKYIKPGLKLQGLKITDLAPSILHLMDTPIPSHMDGRVITEMLSSNFKAGYTPDHRIDWDGLLQGANPNGVMSAEEEAILTERLRDLGYVG